MHAWIKSQLGLRELALKSGLSASTVHAYLKGPSLPRLDHADRLARAMGVDVSALLPAQKGAAPIMQGPPPNP
jgi:transcriptional regulator with XRE-family HTH domain